LIPKRQPSSRHCFVCGVENPFGLHLNFYEDIPGEVTADIIIPAHFQGYPGVVHGGIVAAMLDEVAGRALMDGGSPRFMFTARLVVRYHKNVLIEQTLKLVGRAGKSRSRTAIASSAIYDSSGELLAEADVLLVDIPAEKYEGVDMEKLGWKVYE